MQTPETLEVPITRLSDDAVLPAYAYEADAGVDLRATAFATLAPFERALIPTSLAVAIPEGYAVSSFRAAALPSSTASRS